MAIGRAKAPTPPVDNPKRCVSCGQEGGPLETRSCGLPICVEPTMCRLRAEQAGMWKS